MFHGTFVQKIIVVVTRRLLLVGNRCSVQRLYKDLYMFMSGTAYAPLAHTACARGYLLLANTPRVLLRPSRCCI